MADEELQARLQSHSKAFEGLMSLIPAKVYYGEDNENQWKRKKQTKEEKRAAKKAKLDPASNKSALDVQNDKKRKREQVPGEDIDSSATGLEQPRQGLKGLKNGVKKTKLSTNENDTNAAKTAKIPLSDEAAEAERKAHVEKRKAYRERQKEKKEKLKAKREAKNSGIAKAPGPNNAAPVALPQLTKQNKTRNVHVEVKQKRMPQSKVQNISQSLEEAESSDEDLIDDAMDGDVEEEEIEEIEEAEKAGQQDVKTDIFDAADMEDDDQGVELAQANFPGLAADELVSTGSSDIESLTFDKTHESSASSASSVLPETATHLEQASSSTTTTHHKESGKQTKQPQLREKHTKLPQIDPIILQERLQVRLTALRAARRADGVNGKPARNRQELIEGRRKKEEQRRAHKKELRVKAKLAQDAEAEAARLRGGSGSPMWSPGTFSPREPENNFSFGRVAFEDGAQMDSTLSTVLDPKRKKGPQDVKTALEAAQHKRARINGLDEVKRADIEEKDRWLSAKKRISGEKVRDDTNLLKKTLKRKEKGKAKSEKEWNERIEGVQKGKEVRQKKRDDNIQKRKDEKGQKGKKKSFGGKPKSGLKKRPGFEGSFKAGGGRPKA